MSSLPFDVSFGQEVMLCDDADGGGDGGGEGLANSCRAQQSQECQVRLPDHFDSSNTFEVTLEKNSLGLGFSIGGGVEAPSPWSGIVRVKKIFPMQPAWLDGRLRCGDILVRVDDVPLVGLPLVRALDALRSVASPVAVLRVHRPCVRHQQLDNARLFNTVARSRSFTPATHQGLSLNLSAPLPLSSRNNNRADDEDGNKEGPMDQEDVTATLSLPATKYGRFTVELCKVKGSLGFSLCRGEDDRPAPLRHTVKALLKEPALSDGRIRPGDKLISANGADCDRFSHQELISFLRKCPERVILELYRDASRAQTPASPEEDGGGGDANTPLRRPSSFLTNSARQKQLRYEAKELVRSLQSSRNSLDGTGSPSGGSMASNLSGGGGGMLFRRGLSPHRTAAARNFNSMDRSCPLSVFEGGDDVVTAPIVESPASPGDEEYRSLPAFLHHGLHIEELTSTPRSEDDTAASTSRRDSEL